jgi:cellulose synthase (UDP-forming)
VELVLLVICLRYFAWRCTTLNTAHPFTFACSILQLVMELVGLAILVFQMLPPPNFDPSYRSREATALEPWTHSHQPSVEIWIPTYNESARIVRRAILTCRNLSYGNLAIKVLDDGHRPAIAALADQLGVGYLSREGNAHRKAGNLNHALKHCQSELIAVFDCDFTPSPQFLQRTVGFFSDPKVAIVQTPQHYFQADFHSSNLGIDQVMPGDLDYFYHFLQVRRDQTNAVVCCGTSYVARREALNSIGGYVTLCLVEDYQTSTKLITQGWRVKYLNEVLSMGEVPRAFADFLDQRLRWMQGNIQIYLCGQELPIFSRLGLNQLRWYLLPADLLAPLWRITYLVMPVLGLILGFSVIAAPIPEYISYGGPFAVALFTLPNWLSGHSPPSILDGSV